MSSERQLLRECARLARGCNPPLVDLSHNSLLDLAQVGIKKLQGPSALATQSAGCWNDTSVLPHGQQRCVGPLFINDLVDQLLTHGSLVVNDFVGVLGINSTVDAGGV